MNGYSMPASSDDDWCQRSRCHSAADTPHSAPIIALLGTALGSASLRAASAPSAVGRRTSPVTPSCSSSLSGKGTWDGNSPIWR